MAATPVSRADLRFSALTAVAVVFVLPLALTESRSQTVTPPSQNAATQTAPTPEISLKVEAPSVIVDVIVTNKKGRHTSGLAAEDFRVYEDDAPQKIITFAPPVIEPAPDQPVALEPHRAGLGPCRSL